MVFPQDRHLDPREALKIALEYSSQFDFPLTSNEVWLWQPSTTYPEKTFRSWPYMSDGFYFLPGKRKTVALRKERTLISQHKINKARKVVSLLKYVPTIKAVFITGSVAVLNSSNQDDIDFMIITAANSVWITRLIVVLLLTVLSKRRPTGLEEHSSTKVSDKICDNLYLDENYLLINHSPHNHARNFYLAHEILQARPLWSKNNFANRFFRANTWVKTYLPVISRQLSVENRVLGHAATCRSSGNLFSLLLNVLVFIPQYLYMRPRLTRESVGLHYAFFHPRQTGI
jgi:hypothetical protein